MAEIDKDEYIDTSEFLEPEDSIEISSDFTDITPIKKRVIVKERNECELFRARRYGQWWTLKCVSKKVVDKSRVYEYLRKEFLVGISLWHPNIVRMISIHNDLVDGAPGIVMEYVDGVTLGEFLDTHPPLEERIKIADQMIAAMRYYMGKQVVHCDLKPANIIITHNGHNLKLIDFGLADVDNSNIFKGHAGTDRFAAPEQKRSDGVVDCRSDIYAFGNLLKMLRLPIMFRSVIRRCLKEKQADRYQNPVELYLDFEKAKAFRVSRWAITTLVLGVLFIAGAFVLGNWISEHTQNHETPSSRDKIIGGKMPVMFFSDSVADIKDADQVYVVHNATMLCFLSNSKTIPSDINPDLAVDLGLSVKWAPFNVGCKGTMPNNVGGYYNWGDASGKNIDGEAKPYNLPRQNSSISSTPLDIAYTKWGHGWRMPTSKEMQELIDKCTWKIANKRGEVPGYHVTGPSGESIFLPFAGYRRGPALFKQGVVGCYWSATPYTDARQSAAYFLEVDGDVVSVSRGDFASTGYSVRPVLDK